MSADKLTALEKRLNETSTRIQSSAKRTLIVGLVLLIPLGAYLMIGLPYVANNLLDPNQFIPLGFQTLNDNIPELKATIEDEFTNGAPVWAASLSEQAVESVPKGREALEEYVLEQTDKAISQVVNVGEDEFRSLIKQNHDQFKDTIGELAAGEDYSDETLEIFMAAINEELGRDIEQQSEDVLGTVIALNTKLERLAEGRHLNAEESLERDVIRILRYLRLKEVDPGLTEEVDAVIPEQPKTAEEAGTDSTNDDSADDDTSSDTDDNAASDGDDNTDDTDDSSDDA